MTTPTDAQCSMLNAQCSMLNAQCSLNSQLSTLNSTIQQRGLPGVTFWALAQAWDAGCANRSDGAEKHAQLKNGQPGRRQSQPGVSARGTQNTSYPTKRYRGGRRTACLHLPLPPSALNLAGRGTVGCSGSHWGPCDAWGQGDSGSSDALAGEREVEAAVVGAQEAGAQHHHARGASGLDGADAKVWGGVDVVGDLQWRWRLSTGRPRACCALVCRFLFLTGVVGLVSVCCTCDGGNSQVVCQDAMLEAAGWP